MSPKFFLQNYLRTFSLKPFSTYQIFFSAFLHTIFISHIFFGVSGAFTHLRLFAHSIYIFRPKIKSFSWRNCLYRYALALPLYACALFNTFYKKIGSNVPAEVFLHIFSDQCPKIIWVKRLRLLILTVNVIHKLSR